MASGRKQVKQWWPCAAAGLLGMLPEALALCDKSGQQAPAQVLPDLQGKGQERKGSITGDLIIHELFVFGVNEIATLSIWYF